MTEAVDPAEFIRTHTVLAAPPLVPEVRLHLATEVTPLWEATEATLARQQLPPPYWAFAWPGGQAVSRYLLDHSHQVRGRRVLDFASGSGLAAIAACRAGAGRVLATEIDAMALAAIRLNAAANAVEIEATDADLMGQELPGFDVVVAGDVCYEQPMAGLATDWLRGLARRGVLVILGDPGRAYVPKSGLARLADYVVPTSLDLEDRTERHTTVWRLLG